MGARNPQTQAKRAREFAVKEKRERKRAKKAEVAALRRRRVRVLRLSRMRIDAGGKAAPWPLTRWTRLAMLRDAPLRTCTHRDSEAMTGR